MSYYTKKLYYNDPFLSQCDAEIVEIRNGNELCLSQTVAYPEGGGQISDIGSFIFGDLEIPFENVQKGSGRIFCVQDFPTVHLDTPVYHTVDTQYANMLSIGQKLEVKINLERRMWATLHHSAIHLALMVASELRGDLYHRIKGCNITTEHARMDFSLPERFSEIELFDMNDRLNSLISECAPIVVFPYKGENEAWFWQCKDYVCPCGGTHVTNTSQIGHAIIKRKGIGKGFERIIVTVDSPMITTKDYYPS